MMRGRAWLGLGVVALLAAGAAQAQNLDQGKSATRLFADSCATCHHSPRGLSKGRLRLTLYMFLRDHYASNSDSAWELASYLAAADDTPRGRPGGAMPKHAQTSKPRPPASIPQR